MSSASASHDRFLRGAVSVLQPAEGYRAGMDAVLLAASLEAGPGLRLAEAGCGAGAALLCAAHRLSSCAFVGFEREPGLLALAQESILANGYADRVSLTPHDVSERPTDLQNQFDQSFCNPPFFEPGTVRPPASDKRAAYIATTPLKAWVLFLLHMTRPGGRITLIHRAAMLAELLELLAARAGEIEVLPVRPAPGAQAGRIIVRARKGLRRGPLRLYEGLCLHAHPGGPLTERAQASLEGAALEWR